jgi:hypothetical protein
MHDVKNNMCFPVVGMNAESKRATFLRQVMSDVMEGIKFDIEIKVIPEPTNPFDPGAIAVYFNQVKIGYIGKPDQAFFDFKDMGYLNAKIVHWGVTQNNQAVFIYIQPYF